MHGFLQVFLPYVVLAIFCAPAGAETTIVDAVRNSSTHATLFSLITSADLGTVLSSTDKNLTLFAPNDLAFEKIHSDLKEKLTANPVHKNHMALLQDVLKNHVISAPVDTGALKVSDLTAAAVAYDTLSMDNSLSLKNLAPEVTAKKGSLANFVGGEIVLGNGIVHVIDTVLLPASCTRTIVDIISTNVDFSTLASLLKVADLVNTLSADTPNTGFTIFAPTNAAFNKLDKAIFKCLNDTKNIATLANLLKYHTVGSTLMMADLKDGMEISSLASSDTHKYTYKAHMTLIPMNGTASNMMTHGGDMLASNGVVYTIDTVLIPHHFQACPDGAKIPSVANIIPSTALSLNILSFGVAIALFC